MSFTIQPASRVGILPLIGMYGRSGSGKTMSALLLARGLVGAKGRIVLVDSENRRGSLFADIIPGGYSVIDIDAPFSPERYTEAIECAEASADCIVVDSMSHSWSGEGGVLDMQEAELTRMAGDNWSKRESCKMAAWIKPKQAHKKFVMRLLRCRVALICCLRGEEKTHMVKGEDNKNKVITDEFSSPLFDPRFIFELLLNLETVAHKGKGGFVIPRKITHPTIAPLLPAEGEQIGVKHGEALAAWCASAGGAPKRKPEDELKELKAELWALLKPVRGTAKDWSGANAWLWAENVLDAAKEPPESMPDLTMDKLKEVIAKSREILTTNR